MSSATGEKLGGKMLGSQLCRAPKVLHLTLPWAGMASRNVHCPASGIRTHQSLFPKVKQSITPCTLPGSPRPCSWPHAAHFWCQREASQGTKLPFPIHHISEAEDPGAQWGKESTQLPSRPQWLSEATWRQHEIFLRAL